MDKGSLVYNTGAGWMEVPCWGSIAIIFNGWFKYIKKNILKITKVIFCIERPKSKVFHHAI
jgi:hypothetical protein